MKLFILLFCLFSSIAIAADIRLQRLSGSDARLIVVSGPIERLDADRFINQTVGVTKAVVILDSGGGAVIDALAIGRSIRRRGFFTAVPDNTLCASSCALIWLAGKQRFAEENSIVGFHAAYIYKNGKTSETGVGNALIGSYLNDLGLSDTAIIFVTSAPPEGIERIDRRKAALVGIAYRSVKDFNEASGEGPNESIPSTRTDAGVTTAPYDPVSIVKKFYKALSIADGNAASALVVPEKRGIGPFNERNITSFFGAMREPLAIQSVEKVSSDTVKVKYTYRVSETQCVGAATVKTEYLLGNTLIQSIKANC